MIYDQEIFDLENALDGPEVIDNQKLEHIFSLVSKNLGNPNSKARDTETMKAKRTFCYLCVKAGIKAVDAGKYIGLDRVTALYHHEETVKQIAFVRKIREIEAKI